MKKAAKVLRICGYLLALGLISYPFISNYVNQLHSSTIAEEYNKESSNLPKEHEEEMIAAALDYNNSLIGLNTLTDPFSDSEEELTEDTVYNNLLKIDASGMMGYIEIPKIDILLPIYHGTSEAVLQSGAGHLKGTSLPVGGTSSHAVLSAHRGLAQAKMFTDLNQLENGDVFYIKVLTHTYAYQVDQILTVEPTDTKALAIEENKDYVTLVTCTPYAINTHRLLVRGTRIPYEEAVEVAEEIGTKREMPIYMKTGIAGICAVIVILIVVQIWKKRRDKARAKEDK